MASSSFRFDSHKLEKGLKSFEDKFLIAVEQFAENGAQKLESNAKINARWQNRTGHARQRLKGDYFPVQGGVKLRLAHGVDYGVWLELAHEKKYSIIPETIEYVGTFEILPAFEHFIDRLKV